MMTDQRRLAVKSIAQAEDFARGRGEKQQGSDETIAFIGGICR